MDAQGPEKPRRFTEKAGLTIPALVDRKGALWELYDFKVVPVQLYFDETGRLVHRSRGGPEGEVLAKLDDALKAPRRPAAELAAAASAQPSARHRSEAAELFERGVAALEEGRSNAALALWKRALARDPENWLIRKQVWTLENPGAFWGGEEIDFDWQKRRRQAD